MKYKILSIDGGGIRGIYPAYVLNETKKDLKYKDIRNEIDLLVGTSTGAIIAGALACGIDERTIYEFYKNDADEVFNRTNLNRYTLGIFGPKYSKKYLRQTLEKLLGKTKMSDLKTDLIITATDVTKGKAILFRTGDNVYVVDAILASISAPYFFSFEKFGSSYLADGGLWASNPSIVGYVEAKYKKDVNEEDIRVLSLGTGVSRNHNFLDRSFFHPIEIVDFINLLLHLQANHLDSLSKIMLKDKYTKINMTLDSTAIDELDEEFLNKMKFSYRKNKAVIENFFNLY